MKKFGWHSWKSIYREFLRDRIMHPTNSLERFGLRFIHKKRSLNALAHAIARSLADANKHGRVTAQSIWVDGTPQARATTASGLLVEAELADLLLILEEQNINGVKIRERGLLIQGKISPKYNKLTAGGSTKIERMLLEEVDRLRPIELYKDTRLTPTALIGSYVLPGAIKGLKDCARYLIMPKYQLWRHNKRSHFHAAPLQIGWPQNIKHSQIKPPKGFVEAIQQMLTHNNTGKDLISFGVCDWSRMISDLQGGFDGIQMKGHGKQFRANKSNAVQHFMSQDHFFYPNGFVSISPPVESRDIIYFGDALPLIPIVRIKILYQADDA